MTFSLPLLAISKISIPVYSLSVSSGGTIIDSQGMISYIQESDESYILGSLRLFLEQARPDSKTMFFIINDIQTDLVFDTIDKALGGLKKHNTGIAFAMPITKVAGVVKDDSLF